ncbi:CbiX/SirB N-terminal domain-containing protein [Marimonas lutisalis]|uniref:CbiX/SirB N-terminal domain-containing protein n=1 Tax=Marimonas lutisalis TaxID=2545756 RepID=UPI0010F4B1E2|nr:CbiX/SirB N-terminal domain-containing protein [Marimonas lutisalis]
MAQVTEHHALIVAHGSPSEPDVQEAALTDLATLVSASLTGWTVRGATVAAPGAVEQAIAELERPLVYPFFMAPGWFVDVCLPKRLGPRIGKILAPLGCDPELPALVRNKLLDTLSAKELTARETSLVLAAHGSPRHPENGQAVRQFASTLKSQLNPRCVNLGFIEEPPYLKDVARIEEPAICVPFFAAEAGHVTQDIPEALSEAGFEGSVLPPLIKYHGLADLIAKSLARARCDRRAA